MATIYYKTSDSLKHYGVVGMKWGVRRGRANKAYAKAVKKKKRLENKSNKLRIKGAKLELKSAKKMNKATTARKMAKANKLRIKAGKKSLKSARLQKKAMKWMKSMDEVFAGYTIKTGSGKYGYELIKNE